MSSSGSDTKRDMIAQLAIELRSSVGESILETLRDEFYNFSCFDENPHTMAYKNGQRDVVQFLIDCKENKV